MIRNDFFLVQKNQNVPPSLTAAARARPGARTRVVATVCVSRGQTPATTRTPSPRHHFAHHLFLEQLGDVLAAPLLTQASHEERAIFVGRQHAQEPAVLELEAVHGVDGAVRLLTRGEADVAVPAAPPAAFVAGDANLRHLPRVLKPIPQHVAACAPRQAPDENLHAPLRHELAADRPRGPEVHASLTVVVVVVVEGVVEVAASRLLAYFFFLV